MPLTFRLKSPLQFPADASPLRMETLQDQTPMQVAAVKLWYGNQQVPAGELFEIEGSAADHQVQFYGDHTRVKYLGAKHRTGSIEVYGSVGMHAGSEMRGGRLLITGDAGDWLGAEMRDGQIAVRGDAGDHVGNAYPGSKKGMRGGEILIYGSAGNQIGVRQRRGLIAVAGDVGSHAGARMIAGTLLVGGAIGPDAGAGMKRGSIILMQSTSMQTETDSFRFATNIRPAFLELYFKLLRQEGFPLPTQTSGATYRLYRGDLLEAGQGEILCLA